MSLTISPNLGYFTYKVTFEDEAGLFAGWFIHRSQWDSSSQLAQLNAEVETRILASFSSDGTVAFQCGSKQAVTPAAFANI